MLLMFIGRGNMGLVGVIAIAFPGVWGALRLHEPKRRQTGKMVCHVVFALAQGIASFAVVLGASFALGLLDLQAGGSGGGLEVPLLIMLSPLAAFLVVRGAMALPGAFRRLSWRAILLSGASVVTLAVILVGTYEWMSKPYTGHASFSEPRVVASSILNDFNRAEDWRISDPLISLRSEDEMLHLHFTNSLGLFYTMAWQIKPGTLSPADGLRVQARSDAPLSFLVELEETGGAKYRTWVDLAPGDWRSLLLTDFLPYLQVRDENGKLDWDQVGSITLHTLLDAPGTSLWMGRAETVKLDRGTETWWVTTSEHFWIRYHPAEQGVIGDVWKAAESRFDLLTVGLGFRPTGLVPLTIVSDHAELEERQKAIKPPWAYANAFPDSLDILTPRLYSPWFNGHRYEDLFKLVPHELVHVFNFQIVGYPGVRNMPTWLNEGLAIYFGGQESDEKTLVQAARQGTLVSFQELQTPFREQANPGLSYAMAKSITGYLIKTYGAEKIHLLMGALARGVNFGSALELICGVDQATFERQWREQFLNASQ